MSLKTWFSLAMVAVVLAAGVRMAAQNPLAQLGLTETTAKTLVARGIVEKRKTGNFVGAAVKQAFKSLPASARAQAISAIGVWAKSYVNSPGFKADYTKARTEFMPQPPKYAKTVDEEFKERTEPALSGVDAQVAAVLASLPPEQRKQMEQNMGAIKQQTAVLKDPSRYKIIRDEIEQSRAKDKADYDVALKEWQQNLPANEQLAIRLREFVTDCTDVDFNAQLVDKKVVKQFANPAYEAKSMRWKECYRAGPEATNAARNAAIAWLKEMGK